MHATSRCCRTPIDTNENRPNLLQAAAGWLIAAPPNAVMGMAVMMLLPAPQITSGVVLVLLMLAHGPKLAILEAGAAASAMLLVSMLFSIPTNWMLPLMLGSWLPIIVLAMLLRGLRSLTLVMQVSVIIAVAALLGFAIVVTDPAAFWEPYVVVMTEVLQANGMDLNTEFLTPDVMTVSVVLAYWLLATAALCLGNGLYSQLPLETVNYGRFRDLNFGRVIAIATAVISLVALLTEWSWALNVASVLFAVFMMQGLAIMHWLKAVGILPAGALVAIYVLLPLLQVLLFVVLALVGYVDAWIGFRGRWNKSKGSRT